MDAAGAVVGGKANVLLQADPPLAVVAVAVAVTDPLAVALAIRVRVRVAQPGEAGGRGCQMASPAPKIDPMARQSTFGRLFFLCFCDVQSTLACKRLRKLFRMDAAKHSSQTRLLRLGAAGIGIKWSEHPAQTTRPHCRQ